MFRINRERERERERDVSVKDVSVVYCCSIRVVKRLARGVALGL